MSNLSLAMRARGHEGEPIPGVFTQLEALGARIRRSQLSLIVAAPGKGKSAIATHIAVNADYSKIGEEGVPTLYFSADSDRMTLGTRVCAGILKKNLTDVEEMLKDKANNPAWRVVEEATKHIWWNFDPALSIEDIDDEVAAYAAVNGQYPHLIVVDNLNNVMEGGASSWEAEDRVMDTLSQLARSTSAAVLVLHHVRGPYNNGDIPVPFDGIKNQVGARPRLILTLYQEDTNILGVCVVKNSTGRADPSAQGVVATIGWMPERSYFVDGR